MTANVFVTGPIVTVHREGEHRWAECAEPECAGWTAAADSWDELFRLVSEWHEGKHGWTMLDGWTWEATGASE